MQVGLRAVRSLEEAQGLGSVLVAKIGKALSHLVEGLVPGDLFPLAASALADALEGPLQAVGVVLEILPAVMLESGAHIPLVMRVVRISLDLHDSAVFLRAENSAIQVAQKTRCSLDFPLDLSHVFLLSTSRRRLGDRCFASS